MTRELMSYAALFRAVREVIEPSGRSFCIEVKTWLHAGNREANTYWEIYVSGDDARPSAAYTADTSSAVFEAFRAAAGPKPTLLETSDVVDPDEIARES